MKSAKSALFLESDLSKCEINDYCLIDWIRLQKFWLHLIKKTKTNKRKMEIHDSFFFVINYFNFLNRIFVQKLWNYKEKCGETILIS